MRDVFLFHPAHEEKQLGVAGDSEGFAVRQTARHTDRSPALVPPPPSSVTLDKFRG